jgi:acetoin utilization deacetylase AcuC-like enzyme
VKASVIWHEAYDEHDTGGHIEGADRASAIVAHLKATDLWQRLKLTTPTPATVQDVARVHGADYIASVEHAAAGHGTWLDADTFVSPRSYEIALLAVGGTLEITREWEQGRVPFALVRPPGHHALPGRAMGFCLFNNVAILARTLLAQGLERVAIIDWDVHHGNGTQAAFYDDPQVLFFSLHQWPLYPGSGWFTETGEGAGDGFTVNVPLPSGSGDGDYALAFERLIEPIVDRFKPQAVLVSAGQDIHVDDPLGSMSVTEAGFARMTWRAAGMAARHASGRLGLVLEGGYDRNATARAVAAVFEALLDERAPEVAPASDHGRVAVDRALEAQRKHWDI